MCALLISYLQPKSRGQCSCLLLRAFTMFIQFYMEFENVVLYCTHRESYTVTWNL